MSNLIRVKILGCEGIQFTANIEESIAQEIEQITTLEPCSCSSDNYTIESIGTNQLAITKKFQSKKILSICGIIESFLILKGYKLFFNKE